MPARLPRPRPLALLPGLTLVLVISCTPDEPPPGPAPVAHDGLVHDPLSMPAKPTLSADDFRSARACKSCHPVHYAEWKSSRHALAMVDPVFRKLVGARHVDLKGREDQFCTQCHSAIGTRGGECVSGFDFDQLSPLVLEGVTCEACHKVSAVLRTHNSGHRLDASGPMRGGIDGPVASARHGSLTDGLLAGSEFCAGCHDVIETSGLPLERPYDEWRQSPSAAAGQSCQDCHSVRYDGPAAKDGPPRKGLHRHAFIGVDPLPGDLPEAARKQLLAARAKLLRSAATLAIEVTSTIAAGSLLDIALTVHNRVRGHRLPTGTTFIRQLWLALEVTGQDGELLYATGDLDADGDLRDRWSAKAKYGDADLVSFSSQLLDARGNPTLFPWRAAEHELASIAPDQSRTLTLFAPIPPAAKGPLKVRATLRFRAYPPHLLRLLGLGELLPKLDIVEMAAAERSVALR